MPRAHARGAGDLHARLARAGRGGQLHQAQGELPREILPGQSLAGGLRRGADGGGDERRDVHRLPVAGLLVRLGRRPLDRVVHGRPADRAGHPGQADRPALAQDRRDHPARPLPRAVREPGAGAPDEPAGHVLPERQPGRPVQRRGADPQDRAADAHRHHDRGRAMGGPAADGLPDRAGGLHGDGGRLHDLRRVPGGDLDRRLPEPHHGGRRDDPLPAGDGGFRRAGRRHPGRASTRPAPASPSGRGPGEPSTRSAWPSRSSSCGRSPAWASPRPWSA